MISQDGSKSEDLHFRLKELERLHAKAASEASNALLVAGRLEDENTKYKDAMRRWVCTAGELSEQVKSLEAKISRAEAVCSELTDYLGGYGGTHSERAGIRTAVNAIKLALEGSIDVVTGVSYKDGKMKVSRTHVPLCGCGTPPSVRVFDYNPITDTLTPVDGGPPLDHWPPAWADWGEDDRIGLGPNAEGV